MQHGGRSPDLERPVGDRRQAYKADVGGSKPSAPTSAKAPNRTWLGAFDIYSDSAAQLAAGSSMLTR
ncbi:hypothetical protein SSP531S_59600 [Streptomyces spongiicola]|uniref:Uncharacterized protein n=1 Tax=Streptomyces spongiicola TaxID=1690221 RepID=A0A388T694_9ACTN|nr:hypothetical protein SSP531S_59600 [Streptomyces spongiicola]